MKRISEQYTNDTPHLIIDYEAGLIQLGGKAIMHKPESIYKKLQHDIIAYCTNPNKLSVIDIRLTNISTSSSKWLFHLFKEIEKKQSLRSQFIVNWYYNEEDDVMQEIGEDFQQIINLPFKVRSAENQTMREDLLVL